MIRHLAPITANPYSLAQLRADAQSRFGTTLRGVNTVAGPPDNLAIYFEDNQDPAANVITAWVSFVAAYTVTHPTPEETVVSAQSNSDTLQARAQAALTANSNFLALGNPTNAQVVAHVQNLTKECSALIRLFLGALDTTTGT